MFEIALENAFAHGNVGDLTAAILSEGACKSVVTTLNTIAYKEIDRHQFQNVKLLLRAIENVQKVEEVFASLAEHGLVVKKALACVREREHRENRDLHTLLEAFNDLFLLVCRSKIEGRGQWANLFLLQVGGVVTDMAMQFDLRVEGIRTFNSILGNMTREEKKKLKMSSDHSLLLEQFAKMILHVGDYEMQVGLSEALCRMTARKFREELATRWFSNPAFGSSFSNIKDGEFEVDCRTFLNEVNSYFGDERRVYTFPCTRVFLDSTELFRPDDENLKEFWIDFNLGSTCVSFFVNEPENSLWESVHLTREMVHRYNVQDSDDETVLTVYLARPIAHDKTKGKMVQILFDSAQPILEAAKMVFSTAAQMPCAPAERHPPLSLTDPTENLPADFLKEDAKEDTNPMEGDNVSLDDIYRYKMDSEVSVRSLQLSPSVSSDGSSHSNSANKRTAQQRRDKNYKADYSRKRPRTKSKLKILPLSSPSSVENSPCSKARTPSSSAEQLFDKLQEESPPSVKQVTIDSGFLDVTNIQHNGEEQIPSVPMTMFVLSQGSSTPIKRRLEKSGSGEGAAVAARKERKESERKRPGLFPSSPQEEASTDNEMSGVPADDVESDMDMGSGVITAFRTFKAQLREHFTSRYQQIEARSLQALTDCQQNVSSVLSAVHRRRLVHLERFQATVVQTLGQLEDDCVSLKTMENETVSFWKTQSQAVNSFCEQQRKRLSSLGESERSSSTTRQEEPADPSVRTH